MTKTTSTAIVSHLICIANCLCCASNRKATSCNPENVNKNTPKDKNLLFKSEILSIIKNMLTRSSPTNTSNCSNDIFGDFCNIKVLLYKISSKKLQYV